MSLHFPAVIAPNVINLLLWNDFEGVRKSLLSPRRHHICSLLHWFLEPYLSLLVVSSCFGGWFSFPSFSLVSGEASSSCPCVLRVSRLLTSGDSWRTRAINHRADLGKAGQETLYLMSPWEGKEWPWAPAPPCCPSAWSQHVQGRCGFCRVTKSALPAAEAFVLSTADHIGKTWPSSSVPLTSSLETCLVIMWKDAAVASSPPE